MYILHLLNSNGIPIAFSIIFGAIIYVICYFRQLKCIERTSDKMLHMTDEQAKATANLFRNTLKPPILINFAIRNKEV